MLEEEIGIVELQTLKIPLGKTCRYGKIGYAARLLAFAEREGDRPPGDRLDARGPEAVGKPCVGKGNRLEGVIRGCSAAPATRQQSDQNNQ